MNTSWGIAKSVKNNNADMKLNGTPSFAMTYFGSKPQTDPEILPPGPESPADHFFQVEMVFCD